VDLIEGIEPVDELAAEHRSAALQWLAGTNDIYRRVKPRTPSPHLVAYFLLVDRDANRVLLCDHRLSSLWLPTGGHVEPGEHPADTVRREVVEELGVEAEFDTATGARPFFLTVTETVGGPDVRHTDVSLWFALAGRTDHRLTPDDREFFGVRWWSPSELRAADLTRFEPHLLRALHALPLTAGAQAAPSSAVPSARR
jgi:8-oxo-dGTP pyrophosphatase MutT (NUDIX family)